MAGCIQDSQSIQNTTRIQHSQSIHLLVLISYFEYILCFELIGFVEEYSQSIQNTIDWLC